MRPFFTVTTVTILVCQAFTAPAAGQKVRLDDLRTRIAARVTTVQGVQVAISLRDLATGDEDGKAFSAGRNNTTTSADLAVLLRHVELGDALQPTSAQLMKEVLLRQEFNDEIPMWTHVTGSAAASAATSIQ
jgi:hypothetical protein